MKRVGRIIGVLGGVAALVWAMRDRFVSIASPKEPEPPSFRVVTTPPPPPTEHVSHPAPPDTAPTETPDPDDLTAINGVGPVFERRLMETGMATFAAIAEASPDRIAEATGVPTSRAEDWIRQARLLVTS